MELFLHTNNLIGLIPTSIFNLSIAEIIDLSSNNLKGSLPKNIGPGLPNLQGLYIGVNKLRGVIPKSISNASLLTDLHMGRNFFDGFIPSTLCALTNLERLSLFENNFVLDTTTPKVNFLSCLENLKKLRYLTISNNPLDANLPFPSRISLHHLRKSIYTIAT